MSLTKKIASSAGLQIGGRFIGTVLGLFTVGIMTRTLGREGYGEFTTAMSFLQFFGILADFGLTLTMAKLLAEKDADESRVASNIFTLRLVSSAALFSIAPIAAMFFPYSADVKSGIAIASFSFFFMAVSQVLVGVFQKHLASHFAAIAEVAGRSVLLIGTIMAAGSNSPLAGFFLALVAGNALQLAISGIAARRYVQLRFVIDGAVWRRIIHESWPIGLSIAFNLIYLKGDIIALSLFRPQAEVGLYGAAYKVLDVITVIPMIFMGLVLPLLAASWSERKHEEFARRLRRAFDALILAALPLSVGAFAVSSDLMSLVAGTQFAESGKLLSILMIAGATVFLSALFGHAVVAVGLQRQMIVAYAADAIISIFLYIILIPKVGAVGAAWVTVFSEAFILLACAGGVWYKTRVLPSWRGAAVAIVGSAVMYAALVAADGIAVVERILIGMVAYGIVVLASGIATKEALALLGLAPNKRS